MPHGLTTGTWLRISADCPIRHSTCGGEAELVLGARDHDVQIHATPEGLRILIHAATQALDSLHATPATTR